MYNAGMTISGALNVFTVSMNDHKIEMFTNLTQFPPHKLLMHVITLHKSRENVKTQLLSQITVRVVAISYWCFSLIHVFK